MKLTNEEIQEIAYRLEDVIGHEFHDTMYHVIWNREDYNDEEVCDEDINKIKKQLSKLLWNE